MFGNIRNNPSPSIQQTPTHEGVDHTKETGHRLTATLKKQATNPQSNIEGSTHSKSSPSSSIDHVWGASNGETATVKKKITLKSIIKSFFHAISQKKNDKELSRSLDVNRNVSDKSSSRQTTETATSVAAQKQINYNVSDLLKKGIQDQDSLSHGELAFLKNSDKKLLADEAVKLLTDRFKDRQNCDYVDDDTYLELLETIILLGKVDCHLEMDDLIKNLQPKMKEEFKKTIVECSLNDDFKHAAIKIGLVNKRDIDLVDLKPLVESALSGKKLTHEELNELKNKKEVVEELAVKLLTEAYKGKQDEKDLRGLVRDVLKASENLAQIGCQINPEKITGQLRPELKSKFTPILVDILLKNQYYAENVLKIGIVSWDDKGNENTTFASELMRSRGTAYKSKLLSKIKEDHVSAYYEAKAQFYVKAAGHAYSLEGNGMEGGLPEIWIPKVQKSHNNLNNGLDQSVKIDEKRAKFIEDVFAGRPNGLNQSAEEILQQVKDGEPVLISTGYSGHSVSVVIQGDVMMLCNRGGGTRGMPIEVRKFDLDKLTLKDIQDILECRNKSNSDFKTFFYQDLPERLNLQRKPLGPIMILEKKFKEELPMQTVGNCSYANLLGGVLGLLVIQQYPDLKGDPIPTDFEKKGVFEDFQKLEQFYADNFVNKALKNAKKLDAYQTTYQNPEDLKRIHEIYDNKVKVLAKNDLDKQSMGPKELVDIAKGLQNKGKLTGSLQKDFKELIGMMLRENRDLEYDRDRFEIIKDNIMLAHAAIQ